MFLLRETNCSGRIQAPDKGAGDDTNGKGVVGRVMLHGSHGAI